MADNFHKNIGTLSPQWCFWGSNDLGVRQAVPSTVKDKLLHRPSPTTNTRRNMLGRHLGKQHVAHLSELLYPSSKSLMSFQWGPEQEKASWPSAPISWSSRFNDLQGVCGASGKVPKDTPQTGETACPPLQVTILLLRSSLWVATRSH